MASFYTSIELSRTQKQIPLCNTTALCSRYDPEKEGSSFAMQFSDQDLFLVVGGLCGGYHIESLLQNKSRKIIVVENSQEDFDFLMQQETCLKLSKNKNVIFCSLKDLFFQLIENYLPAKYGNLCVSFFRSWQNLNQDKAALITEIISLAQKSIKADFSVQSNFGKLWQKNIFKNLQISAHSACSSDAFYKVKEAAKSGKTAVVVAAGPTLDKSVEKLKNRDDIFIIATDTAFRKLNKLKIKTHAVVSIDGQNISRNHFFNTGFNCHPLYFFDLCSTSPVVKQLLSKNENCCFFETGHPLAVTASMFTGKPSFLHLTSGSGTVTITAADLAFKAGFKKVEFLGADFSYSNGKAYTSGTYLDEIYSLTENRRNNLETSFDRLLFRTELQQCGKDIFTTEVLSSYKDSLENYLKDASPEFTQSLCQFDNEKFKDFYRNQLENQEPEWDCLIDSPALFTLLPYMANLQKHCSIADSYVIARTNSIRYNELL